MARSGPLTGLRIATGVAVLALAALVALRARPDEGETAPRERLRWGLYQIHWGHRRFEPALARTLEAFPRKPDVIMFYRDLGRPFPARSVEIIRGQGAVPMISIELWHWGLGRSDRPLEEIAAGRYDDFFRRWARAAAKEGGPLLYRFGFEMNGEWFSWSGEPERFVRAWRRVRAIFRDAGADRVRWIWSPNVVSVPDTPENSMHEYWPGAEHVDAIGLDGYNFGENHDEWHTWETFGEIFKGPLDDLARRYPDHRVWIAETGCAPGPAEQRARWIRDAHAFLQRRPRVEGLVWFHYDKRRENEPNWRIDATPGALEAFRETFAAPDPR